MRSKLIAMGLALVIFGAGVVGGVAVDRRWLHDDSTTTARRQGSGRQLERFRSQLDLDDRQAAAIEAILVGAKQEVEAVREHSQQQILALLTAEQATRYREMIERSHQRHRRGGQNRPPR